LASWRRLRTTIAPQPVRHRGRALADVIGAGSAACGDAIPGTSSRPGSIGPSNAARLVVVPSAKQNAGVARVAAGARRRAARRVPCSPAAAAGSTQVSVNP